MVKGCKIHKGGNTNNECIYKKSLLVATKMQNKANVKLYLIPWNCIMFIQLPFHYWIFSLLNDEWMNDINPLSTIKCTEIK